jgi:hypothetical protein
MNLLVSVWRFKYILTLRQTKSIGQRNQTTDVSQEKKASSNESRILIVDVMSENN